MAEILYEKKDHIAIITINRPEALNSMKPVNEREMQRAWLDFRDDDNLWVAILTGAGDKAFCTGGDMKEYLPARMAGKAKSQLLSPGRKLWRSSSYRTLQADYCRDQWIRHCRGIRTGSVL